jgi:hypothetical protein
MKKKDGKRSSIRWEDYAHSSNENTKALKKRKNNQENYVIYLINMNWLIKLHNFWQFQEVIVNGWLG